MAVLNLFPARIQFVDAQGRLTPEAYRALNMLFERVGGAFGDLGEDTFAIFGNSGNGSDSLLPMETIVAPPSPSPFMAEILSQPSSQNYEAPEILQPVDAKWLDNPLVRGNLTVPKTAGHGILVDTDIPTNGWQDLLGEPHVEVAGANDPTWAAFRGTLNEYQFSQVLLNEVWFKYHTPHDHVPNSDVYLHIHWAQATVDTGGAAGAPGNVKWYADISYAKGHGTPGGAADAFGAAVTVSLVQQGSTTQYGHMLAETVCTDNGAALIDRSRIEPDGVFKIRVYRDPADAADTLNQSPFLIYADLHYQTTNVGTKQKAPNFYV